MRIFWLLRKFENLEGSNPIDAARERDRPVDAESRETQHYHRYPAKYWDVTRA